MCHNEQRALRDTAMCRESRIPHLKEQGDLEFSPESGRQGVTTTEMKENMEL
jgi:hypothetical protein